MINIVAREKRLHIVYTNTRPDIQILITARRSFGKQFPDRKFPCFLFTLEV